MAEVALESDARASSMLWMAAAAAGAVGGGGRGRERERDMQGSCGVRWIKESGPKKDRKKGQTERKEKTEEANPSYCVKI